MNDFTTTIFNKLVAMVCPRCDKPTLTSAGEMRVHYPAFPDRPSRSYKFWRCNCGKIISRAIDQ